MIRSLRKRHRWMFVVLGIVLVVALLWALGSRPDWPQNGALEPPIAMEPR